MDPAALTTFPAPLVPSLLKSGEEPAQRAAGKFGESPWVHPGRLWARLRSAIDGSRAAEEAIGDVAAEPESVGARNSLAWQPEKLLVADPQLAQDLEGLRADAASGGVAAGGDIGNSTIATADNDVVRRGS
jgi:hypothetical protein